MKLQMYYSLWAHSADPYSAVATARACGFDGIEGQPPEGSAAQRSWRTMLDDAGLPYIAEICTTGTYVPRAGATPGDHLSSLQVQIERALSCAPRFITLLAGSDAWPLTQSIDFLGRALELGRSFGITLSFETHRSRCTYSPWVTRDLLAQLPDLQLTCDYSHWCSVCERLVLDEEPALLALCTERARHVHARVGYEQGPQVPHPAACEYAGTLAAHERWWEAIWLAQKRRGEPLTTMTPEFGPDGYLHTLPFTKEPVADLDEINLWMATRERQRFAERHLASAA